MELFLDDSREVFFPGTVINGVFCVKERVDPDLNHVPVIRANGYTLVWKTGTSNETDEYSLFFEDKAMLCPEGNNATNVLPNGSLRSDYSKMFTFRLALPNNLPPSHEVPFGHTRYKIAAYYNDKTVFRYFSVNQWVGVEKRNNPVVKHKQFIVSLCNIIHCQPISVLLTLDESHYLPGETVYIGVTITNNSWKDILYSKIYIIQTTKYWKSHHILPIKHARIIAEEMRGQIRSKEQQIWFKQPFHIPAVIPTTSTSNNPFNFFEITYKIKMQIVLNNLNTKLSLKQKLLIGNWDKSATTDNCYNIDSPSNNKHLEIMAEDCSLTKQENIDFIPKYLIYKTDQL